MEQDRQRDRGGPGGTGRRSFLKGATTLLAAGASTPVSGPESFSGTL